MDNVRFSKGRDTFQYWAEGTENIDVRWHASRPRSAYSARLVSRSHGYRKTVLSVEAGGGDADQGMRSEDPPADRDVWLGRWYRHRAHLGRAVKV